jgi:hypothetical protein
MFSQFLYESNDLSISVLINRSIDLYAFVTFLALHFLACSPSPLSPGRPRGGRLGRYRPRPLGTAGTAADPPPAALRSARHTLGPREKVIRMAIRTRNLILAALQMSKYFPGRAEMLALVCGHTREWRWLFRRASAGDDLETDSLTCAQTAVPALDEHRVCRSVHAYEARLPATFTVSALFVSQLASGSRSTCKARQSRIHRCLIISRGCTEPNLQHLMAPFCCRLNLSLIMEPGNLVHHGLQWKRRIRQDLR